MYRNSEEEREYQNLSYQNKKRYNLEAEDDPTLSHDQVMKLIAFYITAKEVVDKTVEDIKITPDKQKTILEKMLDWLYGNSPSVYRNVYPVFKSAINALVNGVEWLIDKAGDFFDWIFG